MSLLFVLNDSAPVEFSTTFSPIERGIERKALRLASGRSLPAHAGKRQVVPENAPPSPL